MAKIEAVFFDFDGVLRDSRDALWAANVHALNSYGVEASQDDLRPHIHHINAVHEKFVPHISRDDLSEKFYQKFSELKEGVQLYKGAGEVVDELVKSGLLIGLVTTATSSEELLAQAGILDRFSVIVGGNDTSRHKPHPEPVLTALARLGVAAERAIMVGDLPADIQAARSAKLFATIGITYGFGTSEMLKEAGADYLIDTLSGVVGIVKEMNDVVT